MEVETEEGKADGEVRKRWVFVRGDINIALKKIGEILGEEKRVEVIERRGRLGGEYYVLQFGESRTVDQIMENKAKVMRGTQAYLDRFRTREQREVERARKEMERRRDVRFDALRPARVQPHFLGYPRRFVGWGP